MAFKSLREQFARNLRVTFFTAERKGGGAEGRREKNCNLQLVKNDTCANPNVLTILSIKSSQRPSAFLRGFFHEHFQPEMN
jgi:hypothetical protein